MGNQKQKWTAEEEQALLAGIAKHGPGKWKNILKDPDFAPSLSNRSNIDLKDKWRNLSVGTSGQGSRDKMRPPKVKSVMTAQQSSTPSHMVCSRFLGALTHNVTPDAAVNGSSNDFQDGKNVSWYNGLIFEALSSIKDPNRADVGFIVSFIEQRQQVPPNFRRLLGSRLRRLVSQGKLEKVQNGYKISRELETKPSTQKQRNFRLLPSQQMALANHEVLSEAAMTAAYKVAEAENKAFLAAEAVKEAERVSKMAEDADTMLGLVKEIYEQGLQGETILLA